MMSTYQYRIEFSPQELNSCLDGRLWTATRIEERTALIEAARRGTNSRLFFLVFFPLPLSEAELVETPPPSNCARPPSHELKAMMRASSALILLSSLAGASNLRTGEDTAEAAPPTAQATASVPAAQAAARAVDSARTQFTEARGAAMKFTEANLGAAAAVGAGDAPKIYKVTPGVKGGLALAAAEGQNDPPVHIRARADYTEPVKEMSDFLASSSYQDDIKALLVEVDKSTNFMKGLKLRIAEKENFVDSLVSREDLLQADVNKDKQSLDNLQSHVKAMRARVEKLKKTKQLAELQAQFDEYSSAAGQISAQAAQLNSVKSALKTKMSELSGERDHLGDMELAQMRDSIDVGPGAGSEAGGLSSLPEASGAAGGEAAGGEAAGKTAAGGEASAGAESAGGEAGTAGSESGR